LIANSARWPTPVGRLLSLSLLLCVLLLASCGASAKVSKPTPRPSPTTTPQPPAQTVFAGDGNGNVYALSAANGSVQWSDPLGGGAITDLSVNELAQGQGYLYVVTAFAGLYALSLQDGSPFWHFADVRGASVLLDAEVVCVDDAQGVYLVDALNGHTTKFLPFPNSHLLTIANNVLYFTYTQNKLDAYLVAINLITTDQLWQFPIQGDANTETDAAINQAVEDAGRLYVETTTGHVLALNEQTGALVWDSPTNESMSAIAVQGNTLYAGGGNLAAVGHVYAFDEVTGARLWKSQVVGNPFAFQAADSSQLYVGTNDYSSSGYLYALGSSSGAVTWRSTSIGAIQLVPNESMWLAAGVLYVGGVGAVDAFHATNGQSLWTYTLPEGGATYSTAIA